VEIYFSDNWIDNFLATRDPDITRRQVNFIVDKLSQEDAFSILDLGCGLGRHSIMLSALGFDVIGIDINEELLIKAKKISSKLTNSPIFLRLDMRDIKKLDRKFDVILILWQSFGYYSEKENNLILEQIHLMLNPGGILVLDIYNKPFFEKLLKTEGTREFKHLQGTIIEKSKFENNRLFLSLTYPDKTMDVIEWQLYSISELRAIGKKIGFHKMSFYTDFSNQVATDEDSRIQVIFLK
jgi:SAM-dependent methyltransferase